MGQLVNGIMGFIKQAIVISMMGSFLLLVAGEVRLAALKKASQGSSKLSGFTQKMTQTKLRLNP
jgi:hypothetical protein